MTLTAVAMTQKQAKAWVRQTHRHLKPPVGDVIRVAAARDGEIVGVAMAGYPVARELRDGATLEVARVATDGTRNACSFLYGRIRRAGQELGFRRFVTYTRQDDIETGASLRAAGWRQAGLESDPPGRAGIVKGRQWGTAARPREENEVINKIRWMYP